MKPKPIYLLSLLTLLWVVLPGVSSWLDRNYVGDANQAADPANWCADPSAVAPIGGGPPGSTAGDRGTPGIVNPGC